MEGFREYQSKPITRRAYQVKASDSIQGLDACTFEIKVGAEWVRFKAYDTVFPGDYIIYLSGEEAYHCRQAVFHERNIVD